MLEPPDDLPEVGCFVCAAYRLNGAPCRPLCRFFGHLRDQRAIGNVFFRRNVRLDGIEHSLRTTRSAALSAAPQKSALHRTLFFHKNILCDTSLSIPVWHTISILYTVYYQALITTSKRPGQCRPCSCVLREGCLLVSPSSAAAVLAMSNYVLHDM